jgi:TRAP-type C4-dicarboxylate transport system permease small subunit
MLAKLNRIISTLLDWAIGIIMAATVLILFVGVVLRYGFSAPLFWSEEITVLGLIWMTFLGGAILVRTDKNVCITIFCDMCNVSSARWMKLTADGLVIIMLLVMIYQSWALSGRLAYSTTPALRLQESWFGYALIAGFVCMLYFQIQRFIALIRGKSPFPGMAEHDGECGL